MRMNERLHALRRFLIFEGLSWLDRWGNDAVLYVNDTFDNEGYSYTLDEIEYVKKWIVKRTGGY